MAKPGKVYLVGAGPGDPGLLTVKGLRCLHEADLILYDGLVNPLLLRHTSAEAERTCRTDGPGGRVLKQDEINQRLIAAAQEGKTVVRLKGGDPFIFGRGSEEVAALADEGIPFEVVSGITAATAAAEYAGISLTHRKFASAVAFVTGHEDPAKPDSAIDYDSLAKFPGTLVIYMGLHRLAAISMALIQAGKDPQCPACIISRATTPAQQTVAATLEQLPDIAEQAGIRAPSLIIVGDCVTQRQKISWFENRPLFGKRIGITRPSAQADSAINLALELGADPVLLPTIEILPPEDYDEIDHTLQQLAEYDWLVFTSANGVRGLLGRLWETGGDLRRLSSLKIAAIGPATADALAAYHLKADLIPQEFRAETLADELKSSVNGNRVLWARASRGRDVLPNELTAAGAQLDQLVVYQNVDVNHLPTSAQGMIEQGEIDWIGLSSPSIARSLKCLLSPDALAQIGTSVKLAAISPVTAAAAREIGLPVAIEAKTYTWPGIFTAIVAKETATSDGFD